MLSISNAEKININNNTKSLHVENSLIDDQFCYRNTSIERNSNT